MYDFTFEEVPQVGLCADIGHADVVAAGLVRAAVRVEVNVTEGSLVGEAELKVRYKKLTKVAFTYVGKRELPIILTLM